MILEVPSTWCFRFPCHCRRLSLEIHLHCDLEEQVSMTPSHTLLPSRQSLYGACAMQSPSEGEQRRGWGVTASHVVNADPLTFTYTDIVSWHGVGPSVLLWCFRRVSCLKQEVRQNTKIPPLEVILYESMDTFQELFITKDIIFSNCNSSSTFTVRHVSQTTSGHFSASFPQ